MIGNDVVCLATAKSESNWRRPNYLTKIFTDDEQQFILQSADRDVAVWSLWSKKEAVYKIVNRMEHIMKFNPLQYSCGTLESTDFVVYKNAKYFTVTESTSEIIHTIAVTTQSDFKNVIKIDADKIEKVNSLPFYRTENNQLHCASVSHHGDYYYAIGLKSEY